MRAMLLCAGLGQRLLPLTRRVPKPVVPVLGVPIAAQLLQRLARHGVSSAVVNLHHLPEEVRGTLGDGPALGLQRIVYTHEERLPLGTGGGIRNAAEHLRGSGPFLVVNGDALSDIDVAAALAAHEASGLPATLVLSPHRTGYSTVLAGSARVRSIAGTPAVDPGDFPERYLFTGFQILEPEVLDLIPPDGPSDIVRHVHMRLAGEGRLGAFVHRGFWAEFGGCRAYLDGSLALLDLAAERRLAVAPTDPVREMPGLRVAVGEGADFHNAVALSGSVALGAGSVVAEGSSVEDSVVMPAARIGPGCGLRRVVVGPEVDLPAGSELEDVLVCRDDDPEEPLPPDTERDGDVLLRRLDR